MSMQFKLLEEEVKKGRIRLVSGSRLPRAASTASSRAIACGDNVDAHIHRPFAQVPVNFEAGCRQILDIAEKERTQSSLCDENTTLTITLTEAARRLEPDDWKKLISVSSASFFIIKNPLLQFQSLIERIANDITCGHGSSDLNFEEAMQNADIVDQALQEGGMVGEIESPGNYGRASWEFLNMHISDTPTNTPFCILDGNLIAVTPEFCLEDLSSKCGLGYNPDMIGGWHKHAHRFHNPNEPKTANVKSAYVKSTHAAPGWKVATRQPLPIQNFPEGMRRYLLEIALPLYQKFIASPNFSMPQSDDDLVNLVFSSAIDKKRLMDLDPVLCRAMLNAKENGTNTRIYEARSVLDTQFPEFRDVFSSLDRALNLQELSCGHAPLLATLPLSTARFVYG